MPASMVSPHCQPLVSHGQSAPMSAELENNQIVERINCSIMLNLYYYQCCMTDTNLNQPKPLLHIFRRHLACATIAGRCKQQGFMCLAMQFTPGIGNPAYVTDAVSHGAKDSKLRLLWLYRLSLRSGICRVSFHRSPLNSPFVSTSR